MVAEIGVLQEGDELGRTAWNRTRCALSSRCHVMYRLWCGAQVQVYGACQAGDAATACLIMELVPGGSLGGRIYDRHKRRMSYLEILQVPRAVS